MPQRSGYVKLYSFDDLATTLGLPEGHRIKHVETNHTTDTVAVIVTTPDGTPVPDHAELEVRA